MTKSYKGKITEVIDLLLKEEQLEEKER